MEMPVLLKKGGIAYWKGKAFEIVRIMDAEHVLGKGVESGEEQVLHRAYLKTSPSTDGTLYEYAEHVKPKHWEVAKQRYEIIKPLLRPDRTDEQVGTRAKDCGVHKTTLYRWLRAFESSGRIVSLVPQYETRGGKGEHRINDEVEKIIDEVLPLYKTGKKLKPPKIFKEVKDKITEKNLAEGKNLPIPHPNTIRNRIRALDPREVTKKREGRQKFKDRYSPADGEFPEGKYPLDVVQVDHAELPVIIVDEVDRLPIGRPNFALAEDSFSRMAYSYYLSHDPPSFFTTGQCLLRGILPKDRYLKKLGIEGDWSIYGEPRLFFTDNANEFRGFDLRRFCDDRQISLRWRPVGRPEFGAFVERMIKTLKNEVATIDGTTLANPQERGEYDSEFNSNMTIDELEEWIARFIINEYHLDKHSGIGMPPKTKFELAVLGDPDDPDSIPMGLTDPVEDEENLKISLLPSIERTVQKDGITMDGVRYFHEVLRKWINHIDPKTGLKYQFIVKFDPRDISKVYFYDPVLKEYFPIPYRDVSFPAISFWELREIRKRLADDGVRNPNEMQIFASRQERRRIEEKSRKTTKAIRRKRSTKAHHDKTIQETGPGSGKSTATGKGSLADLQKAELAALFADVRGSDKIEILSSGKEERDDG